MEASEPLSFIEEEHWNRGEGLKRFGVYWDGERLGYVEQTYPTFERKPRGRRYVTSRWQSKTKYWVVEGMSRCPYRSRKSAADALVRFRRDR